MSSIVSTQRILQGLQQARRHATKQIAVLVDPDKTAPEAAAALAQRAEAAGVDCLMAGGSLLVAGQMEACVQAIRRHSQLPVLLFPGDAFHVCEHADGILLLSLISGRNAELLIGKHVAAAPMLRRSGLEIIPTGYMLVDGGAPTSASYISHTLPIPANKPDIAACTAMAGEMLGLKAMYLDAGSGAAQAVPPAVVRAVRQAVDVPLIVGGGLRSPAQVIAAMRAGADMVVVGTAIEQDPAFLTALAEVVHAEFPSTKMPA